MYRFYGIGLSAFLSLVQLATAQITFTEFTVHDNTRGPACLYACDLDGDGDADLLTAAIEDRDIAWFRNDGGDPIQWTKFVIDGNMVSAHSVHANDIDGDGDLDVIGTSYGSSIVWYENDGADSISWARHVITNSFNQAHEVFSADVDGDGDLDVLGASSELNRIMLWRNGGGDPVEWTEQVIDSACGMAKSVHAADMDGDGRMDVIGAALYDNDVKWYRNGGGDPIQWTTHVIDGNFGGAHRVQGVDVDGDGDIDVVGAGYVNHQIAWWRNDGGEPISWTKQIIARNFVNACIAQAADMDGDGRLDVVGTAQGTNQIFWWHNGGGDSIVWTPHVITNDFYRVWPLWVFDADGDGDNDVAAGSSFEGTSEVKLWRNEGSAAADGRLVPSPRRFLISVYPNPFNGSAILRYTVPRAMRIRLSVFNSLGQETAALADGEIEPGSHELLWDASSLPSGIYFLSLRGDGGFADATKVLMLK